MLENGDFFSLSELTVSSVLAMNSHPHAPGPPEGQENRAALSKLYLRLRRYIHAFLSVASLERLPHLHHTRPWSFFKDAHGNHCEAMSLMLQRIHRKKKN